MNYKLALFEEKEIRRTWEEGKWYFSVVDVVFALTDSKDPRDYWYRLKQRVKEEEKIELSTICRRLKLVAADGKYRLTDEWKERGVQNGIDYAIFTNEIYKSVFGVTAKEYKNIKGLDDRQNLRDSITNIELALTNLGEATAVEFHKKNDSKGLEELKSDMSEAGSVINSAKKEIERKLEKPIVTSENYIELTEDSNLKLPN